MDSLGWSPQMSLSSQLAVAIVAAELEGLAETLASARSFATQVVVGVGHETPETGLLARSSGAQVIELPRGISAAEARNTCLAKVTASWVLWLEPGERIVATGIDALEEMLADAPTHERAFRCLVCTPGVGRQAPVECRAELRLHPRLRSVRFSGAVREGIEESLQAAGCHLENLNLRIERPASLTEGARRTRRAQRILKQAEAMLRATPRPPRMLNGLAEAFQTVGETVQAAQLYREALESAPYRSADQLEAWYGLLTSLDGAPDARAAQIQLCMQALESFPVDAQLLCALGGYLQGMGQHDLSAQAYLVAWKHGQVVLMVEHLEEIREIAAACHAAALARLGNTDGAIHFLQRALARDSGSERLQRALSLMEGDERARRLRVDAAGPMRLPGRSAVDAPAARAP
jgi:tetratricopeptide (TPR) repeat protein